MIIFLSDFDKCYDTQIALWLPFYHFSSDNEYNPNQNGAELYWVKLGCGLDWVEVGKHMQHSDYSLHNLF